MDLIQTVPPKNFVVIMDETQEYINSICIMLFIWLIAVGVYIHQSKVQELLESEEKYELLAEQYRY